MGNEQSGGAAADALNAREVATMDGELRRKLGARGAHYNMKVVLRGDRNSGKTSLWLRLQGRAFSAAYTPTEQIQVATIDWSHKTTNDVVKVEVWDVVDKGRRKPRRGLKLAHGSTEEEDPEEEEEESSASPAVLEQQQQQSPQQSPQQGSFAVASVDATTVDVMRGATAAVFLFDMTKRWTFDYVVRELPAAAAAPGVQCLVIGNFRDMGDNRVVSALEAEELCRSVGSNVHYLEASMRNAFGVKAVATFFSLPFLALKRQAILAELERNDHEAAGVSEELRVLREELTYDVYVKALAEKRAAQKSPRITSPPPPPQSPSSATAPPQQPKSSPATTPRAPSAGSPPVASPPTTPMHAEASPKDKKKAAAAKIEAERKAKEDAAAEDEKRKAREAERKAAAEAERRKAQEAAKAKEAERKAKAKKKPSDAAASTPASASTIDPVEELKKLAKAKAASATAAAPAPEDFKPGDLDDSFFGTATSGATVTDDGWLVPSAAAEEGTAAGDEDGWGATMEETEEPPAEPASTDKKKKKKKKGMMLADQDL